MAPTKCKGPSLRSAWQTGRWPLGGKLEHARENDPRTCVCPYRGNDVEGFQPHAFYYSLDHQARLCVLQRLVLSAAGQFTALHQLGPNNVPADAEQSGRLNLVAITEVIRGSGDCCLDLRV